MFFEDFGVGVGVGINLREEEGGGEKKIKKRTIHANIIARQSLHNLKCIFL